VRARQKQPNLFFRTWPKLVKASLALMKTCRGKSTQKPRTQSRDLLGMQRHLRTTTAAGSASLFRSTSTMSGTSIAPSSPTTYSRKPEFAASTA
jgi:hypothetical protein